MAVKRRKSKVPPPPKECSLTLCMELLGGAWTPNIIWYLRSEPRRFSELMADIPGMSPKVFSARLKRLEKDGIVIRRVVPTSPPTVEYSLTDLGHELTPAIEAIVQVGHKFKQMRAATTER
jgi:DNA-binding HxlR family transcriptional regulator